MARKYGAKALVLHSNVLANLAVLQPFLLSCLWSWAKGAMLCGPIQLCWGLLATVWKQLAWADQASSESCRCAWQMTVSILSCQCSSTADVIIGIVLLLQKLAAVSVLLFSYLSLSSVVLGTSAGTPSNGKRSESFPKSKDSAFSCCCSIAFAATACSKLNMHASTIPHAMQLWLQTLRTPEDQ